MAEQIPYLMGHHEIALLYGVARDAPQLWRKRGLLGEPDLVISGNPYWLLPGVVALARPGQREINKGYLASYRAGFAGGFSLQKLEEPPLLIGLQEVSWIFGKTPANIGQWRNRGTLAPPDLVLSGSPLWRLDTILEDARSRDRLVSDVGVARIRAGERAMQKARVPGQSRAADLPAARIFTAGEVSAAEEFLRGVLRAGHSVEIRPSHPNSDA